jgi:sugar lactone lactonase YvrE
MSSIFISYRRIGALVHARALFERLRHEFGPNEVFMDLEGIDYGLDFVEILNEQLNGCRVMLAVIDPQWSTATDRQGRRRIDREHDYVRIEIVTALARGIRTVPVLIDGAEMPDPSELPEPLQPLARRNALMLDFNRFDAEMSRLIGVIRRILTLPSPATELNAGKVPAEHREAAQLDMERRELDSRRQAQREAEEADAFRQRHEAERQAKAEETTRQLKEAEELRAKQDLERPAKERRERLAQEQEALRQQEAAQRRASDAETARLKAAEELRENRDLERQAKERQERLAIATQVPRQQEEEARQAKEAQTSRQLQEVVELHKPESSEGEAETPHLSADPDDRDDSVNEGLGFPRKPEVAAAGAARPRTVRVRASIFKVSCALVVTVVVGLVAFGIIASNNRPERKDGPAKSAVFLEPDEIATTAEGTVFVLDSIWLRIISPGGVVSTDPDSGLHVAGNETTTAYSSGCGSVIRVAPTRTKTAVSGCPNGLIVDESGTAFWSIGSVVMKADSGGNGVIVAGAIKQQGDDDGVGGAAKFHTPRGMAIDHLGNLVVIDTGSQLVRRISPDGRVTTLAGGASSKDSSVDGRGRSAKFEDLAFQDIVIDRGGNTYVSDSHRLRKITPDGNVSTLKRDDQEIFANHLAIDSQDNLYFVNGGNSIYKMAPDGSVRLLAGSDDSGYRDGQAGAARFFRIQGLAVDKFGTVFASDYENGRIRKITADGTVTTLAGTTPTSAILVAIEVGLIAFLIWVGSLWILFRKKRSGPHDIMTPEPAVESTSITE